MIDLILSLVIFIIVLRSYESNKNSKKKNAGMTKYKTVGMVILGILATIVFVGFVNVISAGLVASAFLSLISLSLLIASMVLLYES